MITMLELQGLSVALRYNLELFDIVNYKLLDYRINSYSRVCVLNLHEGTLVYKLYRLIFENWETEILITLTG